MSISQSILASGEFARMSSPEVLGFYDRFEATEIVASPPSHPPVNVFSLFVGEEGEQSGAASTFHWLNNSRITMKGLPGWSFGVARYALSVADLLASLERYEREKIWKPTRFALAVGELRALPIRFAPPDSFDELIWNRVLKNNFWNGSHLLELADQNKSGLLPFFERPDLLQRLSQAVSSYIPLEIAGLSDRLGNILIQFPVTVVLARFHRRPKGDLHVDLAWHPRATPRRLRANCEMLSDGLVSGYFSTEVMGSRNPTPMPFGRSALRSVLWDDANHVVIAATSPTYFSSSLTFSSGVVEHEPRTFLVPDPDGVLRPERVTITSALAESSIGEQTKDENGGRTEQRIYSAEIARLSAERRFIQYGPQIAPAAEEHARALIDLRALIRDHGKVGAWLWDPYLCADDVLKTLFYCPHAGADLRALTAGVPIPTAKPVAARGIWQCLKLALRGSPEKNSVPEWTEVQKARLSEADGNQQGLRLEFRIKKGPEGWTFHDRFLIFPRPERGALAWSLGTSVNSLGGRHHILQQVSDGQIIMEAFQMLWEALDKPSHLIWKTS